MAVRPFHISRRNLGLRWSSRAVACASMVALSVLVAGPITVAAPRAHAQAESAESDDELARQLYLRGDRYYREGRYEDAVDSFQESYRLSGRPLLLFNLANAYERLGRYEEALDALRRYAPHARPEEAAAIRARVDHLTERADAVAAEEGTAEQASDDATTERTDASSGQAQEAAPAPLDDLLVSGIIVGAAGLALVVAGAILGALALDARSQARSLCVRSDASTVCDQAARGPLHRDALDSALADVGMGVGAAAVGVGVVLMLLGAIGGDEPAADEARVVPYATPRPGGGQLGVVGAF